MRPPSVPSKSGNGTTLLTVTVAVYSVSPPSLSRILALTVTVPSFAGVYVAVLLEIQTS